MQTVRTFLWCLELWIAGVVTDLIVLLDIYIQEPREPGISVRLCAMCR